VIRQQRYCWEATRRGKGALVTIVANPERSRGGKRFGEIRPGTSSDRLIALLDHPRRGTELAKELGISSQRVHQLVIRLVASGVRCSTTTSSVAETAFRSTLRAHRSRNDSPSLLPSPAIATRTGWTAVGLKQAKKRAAGAALEVDRKNVRAGLSRCR
jgi:hypothetical protein